MHDNRQPQRMPPLKWDSRPPEGPADIQWDIIRPKGKKILTAIILTHSMIGRNCHWWGNRTVPCWDTSDCPACLAGSARTWHGFLAATDERLQERWIIDLTRNTALHVQQDWHRLRTLRGHGLHLRRRNGKDNGPIIVGPWTPGIPNQQLPDAPDLIQKLCNIWQVHWVPVEAQQKLQGLRLAPTGTEGSNDDDRRTSTAD